MQYQILNKKDNPKQKELLRKELQHFKNHLHSLTWQSHTILNSIKEIKRRKDLELKLQQLKSMT